MGLITPKEHEDSFEYRLSAGQAAYDRGDLHDALKYARKAFEMAPESERAALLYGYVNLSLAGADPFSIAGAMTKKASGETAEGTSSVFGPLKSILGLSATEFEALGTMDNTVADLPIYVPKCVEGLRAGVDKLSYLNDAIVAVCPFVVAGARVDADYRQRCEASDEATGGGHKAHFLWAFAHLAEAMAFHAVLTYGTVDPEGKQSNLELRAARVSAADSTNATAFVAAMKSLETTLQAVMPVGGACSEAEPTPQIFATLNDLLAVDAAFALIPGLPDSVKKSVAAAMGRIKSSGSGSQANQLKAMKGDLTKKMSELLSAKIDTLGNAPLGDQQRDELCAAFAGIAAGNPVPAICGS